MSKKTTHPTPQERKNVEEGVNILQSLMSGYAEAVMRLEVDADDEGAQRLKDVCEEFFMSEHFERMFTLNAYDLMDFLENMTRAVYAFNKMIRSNNRLRKGR